MQPKVTIITLNWNGYQDTAELIESLKQITYNNYEIIVVDNNSKSNDVQQLKANYESRIRLITCKENMGFAGGNNTGVTIALNLGADYILLLNNDTIVERNFLDVLVNKFSVDGRIGITAPQINYYDEPEKIWSAGGKIKMIRSSGFALSNKLEKEVNKSDKTVTFVSGCCMLIKREVIERIGLFDEDFFLYVEDVDFCLRAVNAGYKIYITPQSRIFHKVANSTKNGTSGLQLYYTTRNRLFLAKKNFRSTYIVTFLYLSLSIILKSFGWLFSGRYKHIKFVQRSFQDFLCGKMGKRIDL